jgi:hypothetical protein
MLRTAIRDVASLIASESLRPPSPEVEARHREEWPQLWWRIDRLRGLLDELDELVQNLRRFRR